MESISVDLKPYLLTRGISSSYVAFLETRVPTRALDVAGGCFGFEISSNGQFALMVAQVGGVCERRQNSGKQKARDAPEQNRGSVDPPVQEVVTAAACKHIKALPFYI